MTTMISPKLNTECSFFICFCPLNFRFGFVLVEEENEDERNNTIDEGDSETIILGELG